MQCNLRVIETLSYWSRTGKCRRCDRSQNQPKPVSSEPFTYSTRKTEDRVIIRTCYHKRLLSSLLRAKITESCFRSSQLITSSLINMLSVNHSHLSSTFNCSHPTRKSIEYSCCLTQMKHNVRALKFRIIWNDK